MCKYCDIQNIKVIEEDGVIRFGGKYSIPESLGDDTFSVTINKNYYNDSDSFLGYLQIILNEEDTVWGLYDIHYCPMCGRKLTFDGGAA